VTGFCRCTEYTVGRSDDGWAPAGVGQGYRQVAHDVADAAYLAMRKRTVFRREQEYSLAVDT